MPADALIDALPLAPSSVATTARCPEPHWLSDEILRAQVWTECPLDPPFTTLAALCDGARHCMRPCAQVIATPRGLDFTYYYTYDAAGRLLRTEDRDADGTSTWSSCEYDDEGRPRRCTGSITREYS